MCHKALFEVRTFPLLFINNLPLFTNENEADNFADNTTMHTANLRYKYIEKDLQRVASGFQEWFKDKKGI